MTAPITLKVSLKDVAEIRPAPITIRGHRTIENKAGGAGNDTNNLRK